jgi:hypothetical protein
VSGCEDGYQQKELTRETVAEITKPCEPTPAVMVDDENTMGSYNVFNRSFHAVENTDFTLR